MFEQGSAKYLITLKDSLQQQKYSLIQQKLTKFSKYFFDLRSKTLLIYDNTLVYIISNQQTKITDLGKQYPIIQMVYNPIPHKNILVFQTHDGLLYAHFINYKTQFVIKKDLKKQSIFGWVFGRNNMDLFIAQHSGVRLYKVDEQKKTIKQVKNVSGKFNSFLYEPKTQTLVCFPTGDCKTVQTFLFDQQSKAKNWFKGPQVSINIQADQNLKALAKKNKSLGLHSSFLNYQLFHKHQTDQLQADLIQLNNKCYIVFYLCSQGKLKLNPISDQIQKQIVIKLPSDCLPAFNVVDNMLVIHMNNQKITFIYDISNSNAQMLVSPFPVEHISRKINPYIGIFRGSRHIMPDGNISKWVMYIPAIFYYLKNQLQIFDFLIRRQKAKPDLLKWLRQNIMRIKQINLSKFWKLIFVKMLSSNQKQSDILTIAQLYTNVFQILAVDQLTPKQPLLNTIIQFIRQAKQMQIKINYQLQKLIFDMLLDCKKYQILVFLCHNDIIKDSQELVETLMRRANKDNQQILLTLAIDMANRVCKPSKVFEMLVLSQNIWQARRYLKQNYSQIQVFQMIYLSKGIQDTRIRQQFIKLTRAFILKKFPQVSEKYLNQAQQKANNNINQPLYQVEKTLSNQEIRQQAP